MLLINPSQEKFGGFMSRYIDVGIPVAVGSLAAYLGKQGIKAHVLDEEITEATPQVLDELVVGFERPYIFGLSCLSAHVARGFRLIQLLKTRYPDSVVIVGGLHPTALPEEALDHGCDFVVRGEGEVTCYALYEAIRGGSDCERIRGISYKRDGTYVHNPEAPLVADLDTLPIFPYELFSDPKYDMGFLTSSRGCPYTCTYCSQRMLTGTTYRYKSAQRIVEELDILINRFKQKQIVFYDDNFCFKKKRVVEVCHAMMAAGLHKKCAFTIQTRADNFYEDVVPLLAEAGFRHVGLGMETGVDRLARLISKGETVQEHVDAVRLAQKYGFDVSLFMIFGLPTETGGDREASYQLVQRLDVRSSKYNNLTPYPGTPLYTDLKGSPRVAVQEGWANFNSTLSVTRSIFDKTPLPYVPETCSEFELKRDIIRYNLKSFFHPKSLLGILTGKKGPGWFKLPERWYLKPRELYHMSGIGWTLAVNAFWSFLPLRVSTPVAHWHNPELKKRLRQTTSDPYRPSRWAQHKKEVAVETTLLQILGTGEGISSSKRT